MYCSVSMASSPSTIPYLAYRDEFHIRPTRPLEWWEGGDILGGRDKVAGGTWLACTCSRDGRVAFLTNVREVQKLPEAKSRGDLPVRFLKAIGLIKFWHPLPV